MDRLTREEILDAVNRFTSILRANIIIASVIDKMIYTKEKINKQPTDLIIAIVVLMRGNDESRTKSTRIGEARERERENARTHNTPATRMCAGWIELTPDRKKYIFKPKQAKITMRICDASLRADSVQWLV
jgi:hypothetical protein